MKKWAWTLLFVAVVVLLLLWATRENYDNYAAALKDVGQTTGYTDTAHPDAAHTGVGTAGTLPVTPADTTASTPSTTSTTTSTTTTGDKCKDEVATKQWSDVSAECKASVTNAPTKKSTSSGNSTGGSTVIPASNAGGLSGASLTGGGSKKGNIWGPAYSGMGDNAPGGAGSPQSQRDYPTLIGPQPKASTMVEGAGIANLSQHTTLVTSGTLPSAANTGSDPNSQFFGTSRMPATPGSQDLVPNPYQEFTPSVGSSKTEPVPYLADFSAFLH